MIKTLANTEMILALLAIIKSMAKISQLAGLKLRI
jgi:hypothetical protein